MARKAMTTFRLGELFCGAGGLAVASRLVGTVTGRDNRGWRIEHAWGVDFSQPAIDTFVANGNGEGICMDAWEFVEKHLDEKHRVDALAFGFPCNSFSAVGKQQGIDNAKFGKLYKTGIRVLEAYDCKWFVAENVSGIKSAGSGRHFEQILDELEKAGRGYVVTAHLYKFEEYGVPQARHRYVIVGIRRDLAEKGVAFKVPKPTHGPGRAKPYVTCKAAIESLVGGGVSAPRSPHSHIRDRLLFTLPGENAWTLDRLVTYTDAQLDAYLKALPWYAQEIAPMGDLKAIRAKMEAARLHCKSARMSHIYRRLDPAKPSYTLTGSGGGGTHVYHWCEHRALTNAERAALQTFPKKYVFCGTQEQVRRQIGMAVPTQGAIPIFKSVLRAFARVSY